MASRWSVRYARLGIAAAAFVALASFCAAPVARAYSSDRDGGQQFATNFCAKGGDNYYGVADYVWLTAPNGSNTVYANAGDTFVDVKVNLTGRYCDGYISKSSGSTYKSSVGGIAGVFDPYGNNGAGNQFDDSQIRALNISSTWKEGDHEICMSLATWSRSPDLSPADSPSACSTINLQYNDQWTTDGRSQVGVNHTPNVPSWDAYPGDTVSWNHRLWNNSGYDMTRTIYWSVRQSGFTHPGDVWRNASANPQGWASGPPNGSFDNPFVNVQPYQWDTLHIVRDEDVGQTLCQHLVWTPKQWNTAIDTPEGLGQSNNACVYVPYSFELKPSVASITPAAESGVTIGPITPTVSNTGRTWSYKDTQWRVSQFVLAPGKSVPTGADNQQQPCAYYSNGCKDTSGSQQFVRGDTVVGQIPTYDIQDLPLGSQVCFALSVTGFNKDHNPGDGWWRHSQPQCVKIGKKPKVQIWGDDLAVRGNITTSTTLKDGKVFGSWVEYGALSVGSNSQFASGAGLSDQASTDQASWSKLTFANIAPNYGKYTLNASSFRPLPGIASYFRAIQSTQPYNAGGSLDSNSFATGDPVVIRSAGNLDLSTQSLSKGRSVVIVASGTVTIKGNLDYKGDSLVNLRDLPQLVIIAKNINIEQAVSTVDAWLIADDTVNTCSDSGAKLSGTICNTILTVHGPVVSAKLVLNRTGGSGVGDASGDPAERFAMRPDAYLWAQMVASGSGRAQTVDSVELPPRF